MAQPPRAPQTPSDPGNQGDAAGSLLQGINALTTQLQRQNELLAGLSTLIENNFITEVLIAERMQIPRQQLAQVIASERAAIKQLFSGKE